jgi:glycosyltransferase involved in cell wall biosynthesis
MKVWHITKSLRGGAGQYALRLSNALVDLGVESIVLAPVAEEVEGAGALTRRDGPVGQFASRVQRSLIRRISRVPYHSLRGFERFDAPRGMFHPDIVHLHGMTGWIGIRGMNHLIPEGAAVFQTAHSPWDYSGGCVLLAGASCDKHRTGCVECPALRSPWKRYAEFELKLRTAWMQSCQVRPVANSKWMAQRIEESLVFQGVSPIPIIPPIVSKPYYHAGSSAIRETLGIDSRRQVICMGARSVTDSAKGIQALVQKLAAEPALTSAVTVLVFGEGEFPVPAGLDLRFLGNIDEAEKLSELFRGCDLFVSPSAMETFGMTLVEAQAAGLPVVGFDTGGVRDAVYPGSRDKLVALGDWEVMISKIVSVLAAPSAPAIAADAREWVINNFSGKAVAGRQLELYATALGEKSSN